MASAYPYLMSSLPMLSFGAKPPFEFNDFLENCRDLIPDEDFKLLSLCADKDLLENAVSQSTLKQWIAFETGLRNELVKIRASRRKIDPEKYLRPDGSGDTALYHIAMNSHRMPSILESEKSLDAARWHRLEELSFGHYFDPDALIVYGLKLLILWRWENASRIDKPQMLDKVLSAI
ncbi:MAG: DUF2764 domain-containing protein [Candidatus Omnitrophica bacterium]|jgi:hypothetical protein|nr:DUF2764 domain-containing protein [Candidatus Omnitrophota bacterium]